MSAADERPGEERAYDRGVEKAEDKATMKDHSKRLDEFNHVAEDTAATLDNVCEELRGIRTDAQGAE